MSFEVAGREIGGDRSFCISELGNNHGGNLTTALELIDQSAWAGADAVKFQIRTIDDLYTKAYLDRPYHSENAFGPTYGEHRRFLELDETELASCRDRATEKGMVCFATAFDFAAVDTCVELGFPAIKIASGSITNTPLLIYAARTNLPLFISTGAARIGDVDRALDAVWEWNQHVCIMQATACYPAAWEELDLAVINTYRIRYPKCVIGLSSHAAGIAEGPAAYVLGARVFEKHATLNRSMKGTDHAFSLEPAGLKKFVRDLRRCEVMIGDGLKRFRASEVDAQVKMGASLVATRSISAGQTLSASDIAIKSPASGIPPYELNKLIGLEALRDIEEDEPFDWGYVHDTAAHSKAV